MHDHTFLGNNTNSQLLIIIRWFCFFPEISEPDDDSNSDESEASESQGLYHISLH